MTTAQAQQELVEYMAARRCRAEVQPDAFDLALDFGRISKPVIVFALMVAGGLAFACLFSDRPDSEADIARRVDATATIMAERFVKQELVCPATASFSLSPAIEREGDTWRVTSYVDSQNLNGANVRRHFTATVKAHSLGQWELINLDWSNL